MQPGWALFFSAFAHTNSSPFSMVPLQIEHAPRTFATCVFGAGELADEAAVLGAASFVGVFTVEDAPMMRGATSRA